MTNKKTYFIPPKFNRVYVFAGFKIMELFLFLVLLGWAGRHVIVLKGTMCVFAIPALMLVLHCRVLPDGRNAKQMLIMRWKFFKKDQSYGLQECERKR